MPCYGQSILKFSYATRVVCVKQAQVRGAIMGRRRVEGTSTTNIRVGKEQNPQHGSAACTSAWWYSKSSYSAESFPGARDESVFARPPADSSCGEPAPQRSRCAAMGQQPCTISRQRSRPPAPVPAGRPAVNWGAGGGQAARFCRRVRTRTSSKLVIHLSLDH